MTNKKTTPHIHYVCLLCLCCLISLLFIKPVNIFSKLIGVPHNMFPLTITLFIIFYHKSIAEPPNKLGLTVKVTDVSMPAYQAPGSPAGSRTPTSAGLHKSLPRVSKC